MGLNDSALDNLLYLTAIGKGAGNCKTRTGLNEGLKILWKQVW